MSDINKWTYGLLIFVFTGFMVAEAQPTPDELADRMHELNQQRLANIQTLEFTMKTNIAGFETESVSRYIKTESNGSVALVPDEEFEDMDSEMMEGMYDGSFDNIIRAAESVNNDQMDDKNVYRLIIRDQELLNSLGEEDFDADEADVEIDKATLWIDSEELLPLKMLYEQEEDGNGLKVEVSIDEYREYSGLPIAHKMSMNIEGLNQMMSDEEIAEARRSMREFEEQLENMPEAQREMIRDRMSGQMEQFEKIIGSGTASSTVMEVVDVKVNE